MAKGARNSVRKANNVKLKAKVFGPVEDARTERLHAKLEELIAQPKPPRSEMEIEQENKAAEAKKAEKDAAEAMAVDEDESNKPRSSWIKAEKRHKEEKHARIAKKSRRKVINKMTFGKNRISKGK